jgi:hypothetical protein
MHHCDLGFIHPTLIYEGFKDFKYNPPSQNESNEQGSSYLKFSEKEQEYIHLVKKQFYFYSIYYPNYMIHAHAVLIRHLRNHDIEFSIESPIHQHQLAVAFHYFNTKKSLDSFSEVDQLLCLQLHEAHRKLEYEGKLPALTDFIDEGKLTGMKISKRLGKVAVKGLALEAVGQLIGIVANDYTMQEEEFNRIFPNDSFKVEDISALLTSGIKLSVELRQKLTDRRVNMLEKQMADMNMSHTSQKKHLEEVCDFIDYCNTSEAVNSDPACFEKLVQQAVSAISIENALQEEIKNSEKLKEQELNKQNYLDDALKIGAEVGKAIHTWVQHSHRDGVHEKITKNYYKEFTSCMSALRLDAKLDDFYNKSRPDIQQLITHQLIQNHENALEQKISIAQKYTQEVTATKAAIKECHQQFGQLGQQKEGLQQLGTLLHKHQKHVDSYHRKRSQILRIGHAICDGITIAGHIATAFAFPPLGAAALAGSILTSDRANSANFLAKQGLNFLDQHNESQWNKSQNWTSKKLNSVQEAGQALHHGREETQANLDSWLQYRRQQGEFLVMNPEQFLSIAYQRYLLEELAEEKNGILNIQNRQYDCQTLMSENTAQLKTLQEKEKALAKKLRSQNECDHPNKYKSTLSRLTKVRVDIANKSSENSLLQIEVDRLNIASTTHNSKTKAIESRLKDIKTEYSLPEHHQADGSKLNLDQQIRSSNNYLLELQGEINKGSQIPPERHQEVNRKLNQEKIINAQLKQKEIYNKLKEASVEEISKDLPTFLVGSVVRQRDLESPLSKEIATSQTLVSQEEAAKKEFHSARVSLEAYQNNYQSSINRENDAQAKLDNTKAQISNSLPDIKVKFAPFKHGPKVNISLKDYTNPFWAKAIEKCEKNPKKYSLSNVAATKALIESLPTLQNTSASAVQNRIKCEAEHKLKSDEVKNQEIKFISIQDSRIQKEAEIAKREQSKDGEKQLQKTLWQIVMSLPPEEQISSCNSYMEQLKKSNTPIQQIRSEEIQSLQIQRLSYGQLWVDAEAEQRINRFSDHNNASNNRIKVYDQALASIDSEISALDSNKDIDQVKKLEQDKQKVIAEKNKEKSNFSGLQLSHNLALNELEMRAIRGESDDPNLRELHNQTSNHLKNIQQEQALVQWTALSYHLELMIRQISVRWDREWQHKAQIIPHFITQTLNFSAILSYLWKAEGVLGENSKLAIGLDEVKPEAISALPGLKNAGNIASFFLSLPFASKVGNFFIPAITCISTFTYLQNLIDSYSNGPLDTLQEQFSKFAKEHTKVIEHYQLQIKEEFKHNKQMLQEIDLHLLKLTQDIKIGFDHIDQKVQNSQKILEKRFDSQGRQNQAEIAVKHCIDVKRKRDDLELDLVKDQENSEKSLKVIQLNHQQSQGKHLNGFTIGKLVNDLDIFTHPKYFTGWLGSHLDQQGVFGLNASLASIPLLISTTRSFLELYKKIEASQKNSGFSKLKNIAVDEAKILHKKLGNLLLLIAQQDVQLDRAAQALENVKSSTNKKIQEAELDRHKTICDRSKQAIIANRDQMKALVAAPSLLVQRFEITGTIIHLLNSPLPPLQNKICRMLHEDLGDRRPSAITLIKDGGLLLAPVTVPIVAPLFILFDWIDNSEKYLHLPFSGGEFEYENPYPYSIGGRFGAPKICPKFQNITLAASAKLLKPSEIEIFKPIYDDIRHSITVQYCGGSEKDLQNKEFQFTKIFMKSVRFIDIHKKKASNVNHYITGPSVESSPLLKANRIVYFDKELSVETNFDPESWVQAIDLEAIDKIKKSFKAFDESKIKAAEIPGAYKAFLENELSAAKKSVNPFLQWLGEYQLISPSKEGFPIALPKNCMNSIDDILKTELVDRHLANQPTLIPYYEWHHYEALDTYSLEIVMKTNENNPVECHSFTLFSLNRDVVEAFKGRLEPWEKDRQSLFNNSILLYALYCGIWDLGMPSEMHKLTNGKAVLSSDEPFGGFYKMLEKGPTANLVDSFDWRSTEKGKELRDKAKDTASLFGSRFINDSLYEEYRHQYYLAASLANLQNSIESKKAHKYSKKMGDIAEYESITLRAMFEGCGLPWPETFEISKEILKGTPKVESLKRELEMLPFSKTAQKLTDLYFELGKIVSREAETKFDLDQVV